MHMTEIVKSQCERRNHIFSDMSSWFLRIAAFYVLSETQKLSGNLDFHSLL